MTAVTAWYTYPAQPLSPLIYLLWDSFVSMAKHMEFLLNYKISAQTPLHLTWVWVQNMIVIITGTAQSSALKKLLLAP